MTLPAFNLSRAVRMIVLGLTLALAVWLVATAGFYLFLRNVRHVEGMAFVDLAWPPRWARYRVARGEHALAEAGRLAAEHRLVAALLSARSGLARAPANRDGRLLLVQLLTAARRPDAARQVLVEGFAWHGRDPAYLRPALAWLAQHQEDRWIAHLAGRWLPRQSRGSEAARLLALAAAEACCNRGHFDRAEAFLETVERLADSREGRLLRARLEHERGDRALGLLWLRQLATELPADAEVHRELVRRLGAIGAHDEARRHGVTFALAHPGDVGARLELARAYRESDGAARAAQEVDEVLRNPAIDFDGLLAVADFAAQQGQVDLAQRVATQAVERSMPPEPFALLVIEALLASHEERHALAAIAAFERENPEGARRCSALLAALRALAGFGCGEPEAARLALADFLTRPDLRAKNLRAVADRLGAAGLPQEARRVLVRAVETDPLNQSALTRLVELELELDELESLADHASRLLALRQPSPDLLRAVRHALGSDRLLFSREARAAYAAVDRALEKSR